MRSTGPADEDVEEGPYATIDSIRERKREAARQRSRMNGSVRQQRGDSDQPYVVDTSIHTRGEPYKKQAIPQNFNSPLSDTLQDRLNEMPSPEVPERDIVIVTLKKDPHLGLGLTIIGGENSGSLDLGIFVKEVIEDGPADRDGQIYKGDRIISINGQSLEGVSHKVAVEVHNLSWLKLPHPQRPPMQILWNCGGTLRYPTKASSRSPTPEESFHSLCLWSISRQTPPTKPKRKPQSFGSNYSLVNSDSEGVISETDNRNSKREPANKERLPAKKKEQPLLSHSAQETGKRSKGRSGRPLKNEGNGGARQIPHFPPQNLSEALQTLEGDTHMVILPHGEEEVTAQLERAIRGFSPTLDMDFDDDNISDDVPTPESSELEDLFGDEDEKKRKPDLNLRKSMNMSPSLSADADKREEGNSERDLGTSERNRIPTQKKMVEIMMWNW
ncbi:putative tyrosine-protein phosphatase non-receptor type 13 [Apostichopus japonicus]|uniref:Putative tyrosine-protein phosphatase non-receptor type 13 n=1 Tax=Stichopus japonicus TaxID=307972 RepID=A0A2G8LNN6_STIJA|nr:putative tyrosine-protein phosphatase non-receptor type 13 [Apostichopus japonicus]